MERIKEDEEVKKILRDPKVLAILQAIHERKDASLLIATLQSDLAMCGKLAKLYHAGGLGI